MKMQPQKTWHKQDWQWKLVIQSTQVLLTLKASITTAADYIYKFFFIVFPRKFSSKDKSKKLKCHLLQFLFGALFVYSFSFK